MKTFRDILEAKGTGIKTVTISRKKTDEQKSLITKKVESQTFDIIAKGKDVDGSKINLVVGEYSMELVIISGGRRVTEGPAKYEKQCGIIWNMKDLSELFGESASDIEKTKYFMNIYPGKPYAWIKPVSAKDFAKQLGNYSKMSFGPQVIIKNA
jgi:hypothetical protein